MFSKVQMLVFCGPIWTKHVHCSSWKKPSSLEMRDHSVCDNKNPNRTLATALSNHGHSGASPALSRPFFLKQHSILHSVWTKVFWCTNCVWERERYRLIQNGILTVLQYLRFPSYGVLCVCSLSVGCYCSPDLRKIQKLIRNPKTLR